MSVLHGKVVTVILRTDKADREPQSKRTIEVACEVKLREQYQLQDGDVIEVEVAD
jgi:CTP-dependent riboflavin kinase